MKDPRDIQRGTGNRVTHGASLLGEGNNEADHSHVKRRSALETKMRQMKAATELGIDQQREKNTSRKRANKETKPI